MPTSSNNVDNFQGNTATSSNNGYVFPVTITSTSPPPPSTNVWTTVDELDWSAQATSSVLTGAGSLVAAGKTITAYVVGGTPTYTTQVVNGTGLVFNVSAGLAGTGSCGFRYDLDTSLFNIGEPILIDYVCSGITAWGTDGNIHSGVGNGNNFSNGEAYGINPTATVGPLLTVNARRYSTVGGASTAAMATGLAQPTDFAGQILYMGNVGAFVAAISGGTDYLTRPVLGNAAPFDAGSVTGNLGSDSRAATAPASEVIFGTNLRAIFGVGGRNMQLVLKKIRLSRQTRM